MKSSRISRVCIAAMVLAFSFASVAQESHIGNLTGHAADGAKAFPRYCNGCHGVRGDGKGTFAPYLDPRPRDFTQGVFKCRSTPPGSIPTDEDLFNTMTRGIVTTAMPSWASLTPQTRADIVAYLKTFSPRLAQQEPASSLTIARETDVTLAGLKHGAELYKKLECGSCHGTRGYGDGPQALLLEDIKHRPIPPYDFTVAGRFKCGETNNDLYRILTTGLAGTPMPAYMDRMNPLDIWDMVHFVRTLQESRKSKENSVLKASGGRNALGQDVQSAPDSPPTTPNSTPTVTAPLPNTTP